MLGTEVVCRGVLRRETFGDGRIELGDRVYIGDDCIVSCCDRVQIGDGVLLGHGVQIFDNNSHPTSTEARAADWHAILRGTARDGREIAHAPVVVEANATVRGKAEILEPAGGDRAAARELVESAV